MQKVGLYILYTVYVTALEEELQSVYVNKENKRINTKKENK